MKKRRKKNENKPLIKKTKINKNKEKKYRRLKIASHSHYFSSLNSTTFST